MNWWIGSLHALLLEKFGIATVRVVNICERRIGKCISNRRTGIEVHPSVKAKDGRLRQFWEMSVSVGMK
jgi:hypothetical protein